MHFSSEAEMKKILKVKALISQPDTSRIMEHAAIVIDQNHIADILSWEEADAAYPEAAVDIRPDAWAIPGLIDAHVHLSFSGDDDPYHDMLAEKNNQPLMMLRLVRNAQASLLAGITTVRDCGAATEGIYYLRDAICEGSLRGSAIVASGRPFTITGGHCWFLNREVEGVDNIRKEARQSIKDGADFLKIMISGGNMTPHSRSEILQYSQEEVTAFTHEAHARGKMTSAHVHTTEGIRIAVNAGIDTMEHCSFIDTSGNIDYDPLLVDTMIKNGTILCSAFGASYRLPLSELPPEKQEFWRTFRQKRIDVTSHMIRQGICFAAGTDAGCRLTKFSEYSKNFNILKENLNMTNIDILKSATINAAKCCGLQKEIGSIEKGKRADITLLGKNPIEDISAYSNIHAVYQYGRLVVENGSLTSINNTK